MCPIQPFSTDASLVGFNWDPDIFYFKVQKKRFGMIHPWEVPSEFFSFVFFLLQKFFLIGAFVAYKVEWFTSNVGKSFKFRLTIPCHSFCVSIMNFTCWSFLFLIGLLHHVMSGTIIIYLNDFCWMEHATIYKVSQMGNHVHLTACLKYCCDMKAHYCIFPLVSLIICWNFLKWIHNS